MRIAMAKYLSPSLPINIGRTFWLEWVLASIIGGSLGWAIFAPVYGVTIDVFGGANEGAAFRAIDGAVTWAIVYACSGMTQWVLLRHIVPRAGFWVLASIAGGMTFGIVAEALFAAQGGTEVGVVAGAASGVVSGVLQWLLLRRRFVQARWWVPVSLITGSLSASISWMLIAPVLQSIGRTEGLTIAWAICGAVGGALSGILTGITLIWLFRARRALVVNSQTTGGR